MLQYHQGIALREAGKGAEARNILDQLARSAPDRPEAHDAALRAGQSLKDDGMKKIADGHKKLTIANLPAPEAQAAKQMAESARSLERGEAGEDKQEEALDRLDEAQADLEQARGANEEELAREQLARVADVLKRLKERQDRMVGETERL